MEVENFGKNGHDFRSCIFQRRVNFNGFQGIVCANWHHILSISRQRELLDLPPSIIDRQAIFNRAVGVLIIVPILSTLGGVFKR